MVWRGLAGCRHRPHFTGIFRYPSRAGAVRAGYPCIRRAFPGQKAGENRMRRREKKFRNSANPPFRPPRAGRIMAGLQGAKTPGAVGPERSPAQAAGRTTDGEGHKKDTGMTPESQVNPVQTGAELAENWQQTGAGKGALPGQAPPQSAPAVPGQTLWRGSLSHGWLKTSARRPGKLPASPS